MVKSPMSDVVIPDYPLHELAFQKFKEYGNKVALVSRRLSFRNVLSHILTYFHSWMGKK